jgi:hypothetical protein
MHPRFLRILPILTLFLLMATACATTITTTGGGSNSGTTTGSTANSTPIPTTPPTATAMPTATPTPSCATLVPGSSPLGTIPHFPEVALPSGANPVAAAPQTSGGGSGQFTITSYAVCYTGTTDEVDGPYSAHHSLSAMLLGTGWGRTPDSFPFDAQYNKACSSSQFCFFSGVAVIGRQLEADSVTDHGNHLITFNLRLAFPPTAPACNANFTGSPIHGIQTTAATAYGTVPLPPISLLAPDNSTGHGGLDICSTGTAATLSAFLMAYMPQNGWTLHASSSSSQTWKSGSGCIDISIAAPVLWYMSWPNPGIGMPFADCT